MEYVFVINVAKDGDAAVQLGVDFMLRRHLAALLQEPVAVAAKQLRAAVHFGTGSGTRQQLPIVHNVTEGFVQRALELGVVLEDFHDEGGEALVLLQQGFDENDRSGLRIGRANARNNVTSLALDPGFQRLKQNVMFVHLNRQAVHVGQVCRKQMVEMQSEKLGRTWLFVKKID